MLWKFLLKKYLAHKIYSFSNLFPDSLREKNKIFKDLHKGEVCFILGSGPSIKTQDLKKLKGKIVITQNNFHVHDDIAVISPKYHCIVPKYQPKEYDDDWVGWFKSMEERLPADTIYFMDSNTKYLIDERPKLRDRTYYIDKGLNPLFINAAAINITKRMMNIPTAITQCISIAMYMGFEKIYLTGMDLDQICRVIDRDRDNVRFYGHSIITRNEAEKAIEDRQFGSGLRYFNRWNTWIQLNLLKKLAEQKGQQIINLTKGGLLDVFERQVYEEVTHPDTSVRMSQI